MLVYSSGYPLLALALWFGARSEDWVRASVLVMDPDGKNPRPFARGLRNAVGLKWVGSRLYEKTLTARAATTRTVTAAIRDSIPMNSFARWVNGIA